MGVVAVVTGIAALIAAIIWCATFLRVAGLRLRAMRTQACERDDIPLHHLVPLTRGERWAQANGFETVTCIRLEQPVADATNPVWGVVLFHPVHRTWCEITSPFFADAAFPWRALFLTPADGGPPIQTLNGLEHGIHPAGCGGSMVDAWSADPNAQWALHRRRIAGALRSAAEPGDFLSLSNTLQHDYHQRLLEKGIYRIRQGQVRLSPGGVVTFTHRLLWGELRMAALRRRAARERPADDSVETVAADLAAYRDMDAIRGAGSLHWQWRTLLLLFSVAAFAMLFDVSFSAESIALLILVLLFHELGHLAGMWLFGYKNLQVLFIPFLGAVALGGKERAPLWQELVVLLLGPVPGIALGLWLFQTDLVMGHWPFILAAFLLVLNLVNLLPIMPLDGGRIVSLALFDRFPAIQSLFQVASLLVAAAGAWYLRDPVFTAVALLLALGLRGQLLENRVLGALLRCGSAKEAPERQLEAIFREMHRTALGRKGFSSRYDYAKRLLNRLAHARAGLLIRLAGLVAWLGALAAPLIVLYVKGFGGWGG